MLLCRAQGAIVLDPHAVGCVIELDESEDTALRDRRVVAGWENPHRSPSTLRGLFRHCPWLRELKNIGHSLTLILD
jgi:hypothetical protein